jgi:hypothetical protein
MALGKWLAIAALGVAALGWHGASADTIDISLRVVSQDGAPRAGLPVRVVVGTEPEARSPDAGARLVTDADGYVRRSLEAPVEQHLVRHGLYILRRPAHQIAVGVELSLLDRPALYWVSLDAVKEGLATHMTVFMPGRDGSFDAALVFHGREHAWSFPDAADGMRLTSIGAELRDAVLEGSSQSGWNVALVIETQSFERR